MASGGSETLHSIDWCQNEPTSSHLAWEVTEDPTADFGLLLLHLKSLMTLEKIRKLAMLFNFTPAELDKIERSDDGGHVFIQVLRDKGIINSSDISVFVKNLQICNLHGVADDVNNSFQRYQHKKIRKTNRQKESEAKRVFIRQLKQKYKILYHGVQPIPYIRHRLFCVNEVFIEGGIEYLIVNDNNRAEGTWIKIISFKDIFINTSTASVRRILEGEPGFGKSTVTLQVAYDWCNGTANSVSEKYEILILLRLKQLGGVKSIFKAIKQFILPKDSILVERDIQRILNESNSVLVILDGFDEYPDRDNDVTSDVTSIIKMDMFQTVEVVLTTRMACLPKDPVPQTQRLRLTGFDENARKEYIRKAVVGNDEDAAMTIERRLHNNPILEDLCQVPLFFVMFAHISHERKDLEDFRSVTSFFRYMIWCFHHHTKNKLKDENVKKYSSFEKDHHELDKVAFEGLSKTNQQLTWGREELCERLGQDFYDHYVRLGILVEEQILDFTPTSDSTVTSNLLQEKTEVRFYHKLFGEWYAAHFVSTYAAKDNVRCVGTNSLAKVYHKVLGREDISNVLQELDPFDLQYVFRFACGLNSKASTKIIEYLKNKENAHKFAILCILEKEGNVENILDSVRDLCSDIVVIANDGTLLTQRSTIQLLDVATTNNIYILWVRMYKCYSSVDLTSGNYLKLKSNLSIPILTTLRKLEIWEEGREMTAEEFTGIVKYSSKCLELKELWFWRCLLPQSVQAESVSVLRIRDVEVIWGPNNTWYRLNLESCVWVRYRYGTPTDMTDEVYQSEMEELKNKWRQK